MSTTTIAEALEDTRKDLSWSKGDMATALGLQGSHYSEVLTGKRALPYRSACVAFAIGVPARVLLDRKNFNKTHKRAA
jgi:transcriptional regulator with XRE-family HTH domain